MSQEAEADREAQQTEVEEARSSGCSMDEQPGLRALKDGSLMDVGSLQTEPSWAESSVAFAWTAFTLPCIFLALLVVGLMFQIDDDPTTLDAGQLWAVWLQLLLFGWCYVGNTAVWRYFNIPYADVLGYALRPPPCTVLELTALLGACTVCVGMAVLLWEGFGSNPVHSVVIHFILFITTLVLFFLPKYFPLHHWRTTFMKTAFDCFRAASWPRSLGGVDMRFRFTFVTDMWTSACLLLWLLEYSFCVFFAPIWAGVRMSEAAGVCGGRSWNARIGKPIMYLLPFITRFGQECRTRNWWNVGKYASCIVLVVSSCLHDEQQHLGKLSVTDDYGKFDWDGWYALWIFAAIIKTGYCYGWDLVRDWGLLERDCSPAYLRKTRFYPSDAFYYMAMFTNLLGRVAWTCAISPHMLADGNWELLFAVIEITRRGQWCLLRLEYQVIITGTGPGRGQQQYAGEVGSGLEGGTIDHTPLLTDDCCGDAVDQFRTHRHGSSEPININIIGQRGSTYHTPPSSLGKGAGVDGDRSSVVTTGSQYSVSKVATLRERKGDEQAQGMSLH